MSMRLHHVICGGGNPTLVRSAQSRWSGRHSESGSDQATNTGAIRKATTKTGRRARGAWEYQMPVSVAERAIRL